MIVCGCTLPSTNPDACRYCSSNKPDYGHKWDRYFGEDKVKVDPGPQTYEEIQENLRAIKEALKEWKKRHPKMPRT